jgi:hypothetical protein
VANPKKIVHLSCKAATYGDILAMQRRCCEGVTYRDFKAAVRKGGQAVRCISTTVL